jgi:hypothetical protein
MSRSSFPQRCIFLLAAVLLIQGATFPQGRHTQYDVADPVSVLNDSLFPITVASKSLSKTELSVMIQSREKFIRLATVDPGERDTLLMALRGGPISFAVDRARYLEKFELLGGSIRAEFVNQQMRTLLKEKFGADSGKFQEGLQREGLTQVQFQKLNEEDLIMKIMKAKEYREQAATERAR